MKKFYFLFLNLILIWNLSGQQSLTPEESVIGNTYYDLQTWRVMQNRIYCFDDGSIGTVWNMGFNYPGFNDLGIGYNYFDGNDWGMLPFQSITSDWAIFPSYTDYGENGEICVSQGQNGLFINWRTNKGTGNWQQSLMTGADLKHPVVVTTGADNDIVHLLYLKVDGSFTPTEAQPYRGFIWYAKSSDGMQTWEINQQISGLGPDEYLGFTIGAYTWAEPKGDVLAFVAGDYLTDLVLMKSMDGGDTWQKTVVWEHPYPMFEIFTFNSDTFYCNGGSMSVALDNDDIAHVAFGLSQVFSSSVQDTLWNNPFADGIVHWREDMPGFKNTMNSLHPDSLSICDNLVGWSNDINANGSLDIFPPAFYPALGMSAYPILVINEGNDMYLVYSSVTETFDNGTENYRHLWARYSPDLGCSWGNFVDLTSDIIHIFDECVFPHVAGSFDDYLQLVYQHDIEPGIAVLGSDPFYENFISYMKVDLMSKYMNDDKGIYVDFRINQDSIFEGDTVLFQNLSCGCPYPVVFSWEFEGGNPLSSLEQYPAVVYYEAGIYDVQLQVSNGINNSTEFKQDYIIVYPYTQIKQGQASSEIYLSPNPTNGKISVFLPDNDEFSVRIINLLGKVVLEKRFEPGLDKINLDFTENSEGIYFVEIKSRDQNFIKKVILNY
jgi:hypothetical protein